MSALWKLKGSPAYVGRKPASPAVIALVSVLWLSCGLAQAADERMARIELAWNSGNTLAIQQDFSRTAPLSQAELAHKAEQGGTLNIAKVIRVAPTVYAVRVVIGGQQETWLFAECENSRQWCYWDTRPSKTLGSAARGQGLDIATTAIGMAAFDAVEANPLGLAILPIKIGMLAGTHNMSWDDCIQWRTAEDMLGFGPAVANILTLAGGTFPLGMLAMIVTASIRYEPALKAAMLECAEFALEDRPVKQAILDLN